MEPKVLSFKNAKLFNTWLKKSFDSCDDGIWLRIYKKDSGVETITYDQAVEEALCVGWIDGLKKSYDSKSWIQKFTPRRKKSIWSKRNTIIVQRLIDEKRMRAPGLRVIEEAKADGRWDAAYPSPKEMKISDKHLAVIKKNKKAYETFKKLKKSELYSLCFRLHNAKTEQTRERILSDFTKTLAVKTFFK